MRNDPVQITRNSTKGIEPFETAETIDLSIEEELLLDSLANALEYPTDDWFERFEHCKDLILVEERPGTNHFSDFCLEIYALPLLELQELYTRTFDLNPVCTLDIGYHLFGEDYKRGEFLARLRETENAYELGQEKQLPDYLPVLLRLLRQMDDAEERAALIGCCLIPALERMKDSFKKKQSPYKKVITFLSETLKQIASKSVSETEKLSEARCQYA